MFSSIANPRQAAAQLMNFGLILSTAFIVRNPDLHATATPANSVASSFLTDSILLLDVERTFHHNRLPVPDRRRPFGQYGTRLPAR